MPALGEQGAKPWKAGSRSLSMAPTSMHRKTLASTSITSACSGFQSRGTLVRAFYYTAIIEDQEYSSIRPADRLARLQRLHRRHQGDQGIHRRQRPPQVKGNNGHRARVDAMELAEHVDQIVLFSATAISLAGRSGAAPRRPVTVVSTISSQPPMMPTSLRRQADVFTDLVELQSKLGPIHPSVRSARASRKFARLCSQIGLIVRSSPGAGFRWSGIDRPTVNGCRERDR